MKQTSIYRLILPVVVLLLGASCSDWTETENIESTVRKPWEQDPALWADYTAALRSYKASEHYLSYARLHNSPSPAASEQDFMRCLPDSLDIVTLTNADNFSAYDAEDLAAMHEKGTKVLYQVDYAARKAEFSSEAALKTYLDGVIAAVRTNGMDGYSFTADPLDAATTASIVATLSAAKGDGQLLVLEGNPLSVAAADRAKLDFVVLDTETAENTTGVQLQVLNATGYAGIAADRLLLAAEIDKPLQDADRTEYAAVELMARCVVEYGPLAGFAAYNIAGDYYHAEMNYQTIRTAIQTLNPSK
ncbi:glycoside hydrolase family 18 [uncultured Alistipes sp.]|uniref:glycoside hydrolase family 18 n=1 Tax=uncultured Alistipes sp. TaxID=538949 RepID=UPI0026180D39|nr:glycoside hydrolase family 18 [uncultured Alistipes sp.]